MLEVTLLMELSTLLLPRTEKGSSTSSEEHYAQLPDPRECPDDADAWKRTTEWTLSGH